MVKNPHANAGDIRDLGSSLQKLQRGGGHGNPQQYSCIENPMDRETWWATVHVIAKNQTQLKHLIQFSSVNQSCPTLSLWLHCLQHGFMSYLASKYHFWWDVFSYGLILWSYPSGFLLVCFILFFTFWEAIISLLYMLVWVTYNWYSSISSVPALKVSGWLNLKGFIQLSIKKLQLFIFFLLRRH